MSMTFVWLLAIVLLLLANFWPIAVGAFLGLAVAVAEENWPRFERHCQRRYEQHQAWRRAEARKTGNEANIK